ncbi:MAG: hypothetical protein JST68_22305 [Bacteroidetes bacterium]|nr:hypothetical protein [Bacteroidota bacterium]
MTKFPCLLTLLLLASCSIPPAHHLLGKWNNVLRRQGVTYEFVASFKPDGSYDGVLNGKVLVSGGTYEEHGDTVNFHDPVCNISYTGQYLLKYVNDSVYFRLLSDSCTLRREGTDGVGLKYLRNK